MKKIKTMMYLRRFKQMQEKEESKKRVYEDLREMGFNEEPEKWKDEPLYKQVVPIIAAGLIIQYHAEIIHFVNVGMGGIANVIK